MFIDDDEMRQIFKDASEERLQKLDEGLLHLERYVNDEAKLNNLLREAHSLKGDANMLGVKDVGTLAHTIEDILGGIKRGEIVLTPEVSDRLYQGLDNIRQMVREAVTGEPSGVNLFQVLASLMGATVANSASNDAVASEQQETLVEATLITAEETPIAAQPPYLVPETAAVKQKNLPVPTDSYRIETIRVETGKLDTLMTQAGELTVSKIRIAHLLTEIEEIVDLWEEWNRDSFVNRFAFKETLRGEDSGSSPLAPQRSQAGAWEREEGTRSNFYHRNEERVGRLGKLINRLQGAASEDNARLEIVASELEEGIRALRLLPLSTIFNLLPRMVRDLAKQQGKEVNLIIEGGETLADKRILEEMKDPLMHMIRNSIDHGIETPEEREDLGKTPTATLRLTGSKTAHSIAIAIADDGRGLDIESIKQTALQQGICRSEELATMSHSQIQSLIFAPGFSTRTVVTEVSGRGVGLDVVRTNVERLKGTIQVESTPGMGTTFRLQLASTLATAQVLIVEVDGISYAIPVEFVETTLLVKQDDIFSIEGHDTITLNNRPVSLVWLADILELSSNLQQNALTNSKMLPCLIIRNGEDRLGILVNALLDEQDVVLKPQSKLLRRVRHVSGATILGTGDVCMVLNPQDILKSVRGQNSRPLTISVVETKQKKTILLVEDSLAIRTQEKRILESAGYEVVTAVDGLDGYNKLRIHSVDAVVSDVEMPHLSGLELTSRIRKLKEFSELPIILVTSLSNEEDKKRGADAGANAYIIKSTFDRKVLLDALKRLI